MYHVILECEARGGEQEKKKRMFLLLLMMMVMVVMMIARYVQKNGKLEASFAPVILLIKVRIYMLYV